MSAIAVFLLQSALIVGVFPSVWYVTPLRRVLPLAVFQILIGIALGPSLFGGWSAILFPPGGMSALVTVANLGLVVFAFVLGLHLDSSIFRADRGRSFALVSLGSIVVPVACGALAGTWIAGLFPDALGTHASVHQFASGIGICIGVTALPVLAAILKEMGLLSTRIGKQALGYAAVNDLALWVLLAALLAVDAGLNETSATLWRLVLGGAAYAFTVVFVVRPCLVVLARSDERLELRLALVCFVLFASAAATDALGLHAILGGLVAGLIVPREWKLAILEMVEMMTAIVLLPFFFTLTGLRTTIEIGSTTFVGVLAVATVTAVSGKIVGTSVAARATGETWGDALALGALMQSKGLMEVVALTVLLDAGIIAPVTFSAMVCMALITTILAAPLTKLAWRLPTVRRTPGMRIADHLLAARAAHVDAGSDADAPRPVVSTVVVSWNDWHVLQPCLASVVAASRGLGDCEIIVIDNDSSNGTADRVAAAFPDVRLVRNSVNVGHTRAVNQGFGLTRGEHVLLLDSDTVVEPECMSALLAFASARPDAALLAPRTFNPDGSIQETARNFPSMVSGLFGRRSLLGKLFPGSPYLTRYLGRDHLHATEPFEVQQISGACMFFARRLIDEAGDWDESYFGYWVDTDWCQRLHYLGIKVFCVPAARIVHHESNARGKRKSARRIWIFHYGAWQLFTRWHTAGAWDPLSVVAGTLLVGAAGAKIALGAVRLAPRPAASSPVVTLPEPTANESRL